MLDRETKRTANRVFTWLLAGLLLFSVATAMYVAVSPQETTNPYTEFYILGPEGNASNYPTNLAVGETGEFIVGITNNESQEMTYTVAIIHDEELIRKQTIEVANRETWEEKVEFRADEEGEYTLKILLFVGKDIGSADDAYRDLRLEIDVGRRPIPI